jgi:ABC-type transport system substrate-binding protein
MDGYQLWHSSQADVPNGSNRVGFRNKRADEIIDEARQTFETEKRDKLFHEFHKILYEEQPYTFCWAPIDKAVWWKHVKNVTFRKERPHSFPLPYYIAK